MRWQDLFCEIFEVQQPYGDFQITPVEYLLEQRRNVILQAPTGAGKTKTAEFPFLAARRTGIDFPAKMIYSVPMRVLANQFYDDFNNKINNIAQKFGLKSKIQTGERPEDCNFLSHAIFTTIDQTLSNFLCVPYSVGYRMANVNAGAVVGSYLVFDEFHLFPPKQALKTTLQILQLLNGITPFLLMTATFSSGMLGRLKTLLNAEVVTVHPDELNEIPSQRGKQRRFHVVHSQICAESVLEHHYTQMNKFKRTIAVCNTVERAQQLFLELQEKISSKNELVLLHSRFTRADRTPKEERIRDEFGKDKGKWKAESLIAVATQVIEVGLDITCNALHTEIAPANSILQRAGRCARYEDEVGDIYIYQVPCDKAGRRNYRPYQDDGQDILCDATWQAFSNPKRDGNILNFHDEQGIIDEVHKDYDLHLLDYIESNKAETQDLFDRAIGSGDTQTRSLLIRERMDSRTILIHDIPETLTVPFSCEGFSLSRFSLYSHFDELKGWAEDHENDWILKRPIEDSNDYDDEHNFGPIYSWLPLRIKEEIGTSILLAINPRLVSYDEYIGFRFSFDGTSYRTPLPSISHYDKSPFAYKLETYQQHTSRMLTVYQRDLLEEVKYPFRQIEQRMNWPPGSLNQAIRLAIALHDTGKLEKRWQQWIREYQKNINEPILDDMVMFVHTHYNPQNPFHEKAKKHVKFKRPNHAGEGAYASAKVIYLAMGEDEGLSRIIATAIARHHSSQTSEAKTYQIHSGAKKTLNSVLQIISTSYWSPVADDLIAEKDDPKLDKYILKPKEHSPFWWWAYFLIVRALRLADAQSQKEE